MEKAAAGSSSPCLRTGKSAVVKTAAPKSYCQARQGLQPVIRESRKPPKWWNGSMHFLLYSEFPNNGDCSNGLSEQQA